MNNAMEFLLEQAKEREDQAVLALNKARSELDDYYRQVEQIEKYRLDYCQQLVDRGMAGLTASQYGHLNRFLTQLDETLSKQKQAENHFKEQVVNCQDYWLNMRKERMSYEWMIEKREKEKQMAEAKREQNKWMSFLPCFTAENRNVSKRFSSLYCVSAAGYISTDSSKVTLTESCSINSNTFGRISRIHHSL